jgi:hypothetical protein
VRGHFTAPISRVDEDFSVIFHPRSIQGFVEVLDGMFVSERVQMIFWPLDSKINLDSDVNPPYCEGSLRLLCTSGSLCFGVQA